MSGSRSSSASRRNASHGRARLTVHGRRLIVQRHQAGWRTSHIAAAMGVSRKCVTTWIDCEAGLAIRSSRPHSTATKTSHEVEQTVLAARAEHRDGPDVLGPRVGVPARPVVTDPATSQGPVLSQMPERCKGVLRSGR